MKGRPTPSPPRAGERVGERGSSLLLAVTLLSLLPRLWLAFRLPLSHNGAWHLLAARDFARELGRIAHPPLFVLLLKGCDAVSRTLLSYRLVPLAAGVASVYLAGRILARLGCLPLTSALGALALGLSTVAVVLSNQVEGYTLCAFFVLAAFAAWLDVARMDRPPSLRARVAFSAFASLAILSEYLAGIFLAACVLAPLFVAVLRPAYRRDFFHALPRRFAADAATLLPPALVGGLLYFLLARRWAKSLSGLPLFYFRPGAESPLDFVRRGLAWTAHLFSPIVDARSAALLLLFAGAALAIPAAEKRRDPDTPDRLAPAAVLTALLLAGAAFGLLRRYPFGGTHRHQILILLFAVLAGFVAFDRVLRLARGAVRPALAVLAAAAIAANFAANARKLHSVVRDEPYNVQAGVFARNLGDAAVVHLDWMNFIGFLMDYYAWDFRYAGRVSEVPRIERYELSNGGRRLTVIQHRWIWIMDFRKQLLYTELASSYPKSRPACERTLCVDRNLFFAPRTPRPPAERAALEREIPALAAAAGLTLRSFTVSDDFVAAELCRNP